jgi:transposase
MDINQHGAPLRARSERRAASRRRSSWPLENNDVRRGAAAHGNGRADGPRRADQRRLVPGLCRAGSGSRTQTGRHRDDRDERRSRWDNLGSHKGPSARAAIEAAGAKLLYLPPYSPDFNPIENAFSKLKALLRKAAERTVNGLWNRIGTLLPNFTPHECANFFAAAGYEPD